MNKFVLGALALTASSTPCLAGTDWSDLDRDLDLLASSLAPAQTGPTISGWISSRYGTSSDFQPAGGGGNDLGGFSLHDARLMLNGGIANVSVLLEVDGTTNGDVSGNVFGATSGPGALAVLDAWAAWNITNELRLQMGNFRAPFLGSSLRNANMLLFMDRSILGDTWAFRDQGLQIGGNWGMWGFAAAVQNGIDAQGDDNAFSARVHVTPMGTPAMHEGGLGATGDPTLTVGAGFYQDDDTIVDDVSAFCLDASFTVGIFSVAGEFVDFDEGVGVPLPGGVVTDASPWNLAFGVMAIPDQLEIGLRFEDFDDDNDTTLVTVGANWYLQGHAAKWQLNYSTADSDLDAQEGEVLQAGLLVSI
jgi:hypothetical protein